MVSGRQIATSKAEERRQKLVHIRRRRRIQVVAAVVIVFAIIISSIQLYRSGLFNIKKIIVSGNKSVVAGKVIEACNIGENDNIISFSTAKLRQKLLKNPWVKEVSVTRALPDTLRVQIIERVPVAIISHGSKFYLVDDDFFIISELQYADGAKVPTITDLPVERISVGDRLMDESLKNAIDCLKSMDSSLAKTITLLSASSVDKLSLYNKDNIEILYGEANQVDEKNKVIKTILSKQGKQVVFIDIRSYPRTDPVLKRIDTVP